MDVLLFTRVADLRGLRAIAAPSSSLSPRFPHQPRYRFDCMSPMVWKHDGVISWGDEDTVMVISRLRFDGVGYSTNASPEGFDVYVCGHPQRQFARGGEARPRKPATAASSKREQVKKDMPWITDDDLDKAFSNKKTKGNLQFAKGRIQHLASLRLSLKEARTKFLQLLTLIGGKSWRQSAWI